MKKDSLVYAEGSGMFTDLYELTMTAVYLDDEKDKKGIFELFVRSLPKDRGYLLLSGINDALRYLENFRFSREDIEYLRNLNIFRNVNDEFFDTLENLRFTGDVYTMHEGSVFFGNEPVLRVEAPIQEAQLVETALLNMVSYVTAIATKASRIVYASRIDGRKRLLVEFGARRSPGFTASLVAARSAYIAGFDGTSNVYAGETYGIPIFGTMAHSFVLSFKKEEDAFRSFAKLFPQNTVLLIDTYDTLKAAERVKHIRNAKAVRLDSGDAKILSKKVRKILDKQGMRNTGIFVSGDLDEYMIYDLVRSHSPINGFGVGTKLVVSSDSPYLNSVYKLVGIVEDERTRWVSKFSEGKLTLPGRKQVWRFEEGGRFAYDVLSMDSESFEGKPMLQKWMENGKIVRKLPSLEDIRKHAEEELARLPDEIKRLRRPRKYEVRVSEGIRKLLKSLEKEYKGVRVC